MSNVSLKNIVKTFNQTKILNNLSIDIKDGEFIVILGPSGCGKSTLLRVIAGLETITSGSILIDQKDVCRLEPKDRKIAMVFQNYALYPHMSVYKNIAYGLILHKVPKDEVVKKVQYAADLLQLNGLLERKPNELSGGQRQRVAMGRAIVREPNVFLFDEPLSNLDAKLRTQMRFEIKNIHNKVKTTSIYVTHDQIEAMTLADRIILLNKGNIEQIGSPLELYHNPSSIFVGGFIGNPPMNFISYDNIKKMSCNIPLPIDSIVGIRPENIQIVSSDSENSIRVRINLIESVGYETIIYGIEESTGQDFIVKAGGFFQKNGEYIYLNLTKENIHIFDSKTEKRIDKKIS